MATLTAPELLDWLGKSALLTVPQVDALRPTLASWPDGHTLAKELIKRDWLTPYQVNQILQGKGEALVLGPNRLMERIGEGAMGQVFKAFNTRLGRIVAVKMIHKEHVANTRAMERFQREVKSASKLDHANIVLVRDADMADGRPYLVMDFIDGEDLSHRVKEGGPLPLAQAVEFIRQAALGLQHAFERGVVHRDIKPGNLMLVSSGAPAPLTAPSLTSYQVKILDFGLARLEDDESANRLTQIGSILGTVDYIAPEQAQDARSADIRADIYALGCTLFYLLTAKPPFAGANVVEKVAARMIGEPPSVRALRPDVPAGLDAVMQRMMAKKPEDRYQAPIDAAQALAPFTLLSEGDSATATLNLTDLTAALTAQKLAQAIPMTQPMTASPPVYQAFPVAQPLTGVPVAQALPVAAPFAAPGPEIPSGAPPVDAASGSPMFTDASSGSSATFPAATPALGRATARGDDVPHKRLFLYASATIGGIVVLGVIILLIIGNTGPPAPPKRGYFKPGAALQLMPLDPIITKEGYRKPIIVRIQRREFYGPVTVRFEDLPEGLSSKEITLTDKQDTSQLYLTTSFGIGAMKKDLRLVAIAENLRDAIILPVTIENPRN